MSETKLWLKGDKVYKLECKADGELYKKPRLLAETLPRTYKEPGEPSYYKVIEGTVKKRVIFEGRPMYLVRFPTAVEVRGLGMPCTASGWYPGDALVGLETAKVLRRGTHKHLVQE